MDAEEPSPLGGSDRFETGTEMVLAAAITGLGVVTGPVGAAGLAGFGSLVLHTLRVERRRRAEQLSREVFSDADAEEMITRVIETPRLMRLVDEAAAAALRTELESKRIALGRALRRGVLAEDDATVDKEELLIRTLAVVEAPEIKGLQAVAEEQASGSPHQSIRTNLAARFGEDEETLSLVMGTLEGLGLVRDPTVGAIGGGPGQAWAVTPFGNVLLQWLRDAEDT